MNKLTPEQIRAAEAALDKGLRVEMLRQRDGTILIQSIQRKRLKSDIFPTE